MPLYEVILRCRMGSLASLVTFYKDLVTAAHMHNGIVRTAEFMGDRVLQKNYRTKDERIHGLGRYIRVEMDLNPEAKAEVDVTIRKSTQVLNFWMFIVKNHVYTQRAFNRAASQLGPTHDSEEVDKEYVRRMWQLWREKERAKRQILRMRLQGPTGFEKQRELQRQAIRNTRRILMGDPSFRAQDPSTYDNDLSEDYGGELEKEMTKGADKPRNVKEDVEKMIRTFNKAKDYNEFERMIQDGKDQPLKLRPSDKWRESNQFDDL